MRTLSAQALKKSCPVCSHEHHGLQYLMIQKTGRVRMVTSKSWAGTSLAVQWLRLWTSTVGGTGSIPGQGTLTSQTTWCGQKNKSWVTRGYGAKDGARAGGRLAPVTEAGGEDRGHWLNGQSSRPTRRQWPPGDSHMAVELALPALLVG